MEKAISLSVLRGRPYGGVSILVHNSFSANVECVKCAERFGIIRIDPIILVNVYFPYKSTESVCIINHLLQDIADIISLFPDSIFVMGGDLNTDMSEDSGASRSIKNFMIDYYMTLCNDIIKLYDIM